MTFQKFCENKQMKNMTLAKNIFNFTQIQPLTVAKIACD